MKIVLFLVMILALTQGRTMPTPDFNQAEAEAPSDVPVSDPAISDITPAADDITLSSKSTDLGGISIIQKEFTPRDLSDTTTTRDILTSQKYLDTTDPPESTATRRDVSRSKEYEAMFSYDEDSLRKWGLVSAFILFLLGILVLLGERCSQCSCRRKQRRKYQVA